jgi:hypothetical protein
MIVKTILPVLALSSALLNGAASAAETKLSTKAFKDDGKASKKGEKGEASAKAFKEDEGDADAKAQKVSKASKSKAGKMFKSEKAGSSKAHKQTVGPDYDYDDDDAPKTNGSIDYEPLNTRTDYRSEFLDEDYWHPKSSNFEIIDWDKWESACGDWFQGEGRVYDPPQRSEKPGIFLQSGDAMAWWQRSQLNFPQTWAESVKPDAGAISGDDPEILAKLLGPNPDSGLVPEALRNNLLWMQDNDASELLVSFNRGAWRSDAPGGRSVGLTYMGSDWTNAPNHWGHVMAGFSDGVLFNWQASPDGRWIKFAGLTGGDPSDPEGTVDWFDMYVVQEGDVFTDREGGVLTDVVPGDIVRYTFGKVDPYDCDPDNYRFQYFARKVALLDEATGKITPNSPHYERLLEFVAAQPPAELHLKTMGFTNAASMTQEERWDFQVTHLSRYQQYASAPTPPHGDDIENL